MYIEKHILQAIPPDSLFRDDTVMFYRRTHTNIQFSYCLSSSGVNNTPFLCSPSTAVGEGRIDGREEGRKEERKGWGLTTKPA